jgi:hypothetical protein
MNVTAHQADTSEEVEKDRLQRIEELNADHDPGWWDEYRPGSFGCHELLDRTSLAMNALDEWVLSHPACVGNEEWFALVQRAFDALYELYQGVGAAHLGGSGGGHESVPTGGPGLTTE